MFPVILSENVGFFLLTQPYISMKWYIERGFGLNLTVADERKQHEIAETIYF